MNDPWVIAGLVGMTLWTNVLMVWLKKKFPEWQTKAWAPPVIGMVTALLGALMADQIHSWQGMLAWVGTGLGAGSTASSLRDVYIGK